MMMLVICFTLSACVRLDKVSKEKNGLLHTYDNSELLPFDIKPLGDKDKAEEYAFLLSSYGDAYTEIATGSLDKYKSIYTTPDDCYATDMHVNKNYILWFEAEELTETNYNYKLYLYDNKTKSKTVILEESLDDNDGWYAISYFGIYNDKVYWLRNDFTKKVSEILVYDIAKKEKDVLISLPFIDDSEYGAAISCLKVHDNLLIYSQLDANGQKLIAFDIDKNKKAYEVSLKSTVGTIYNADFEEKTGYFALYYSALNSDGTEKNEAVGAISTDSDELMELFSIRENHYLYRERLNIIGDHIYYDIVANVSGNIEDHYSSAIYNYKTHGRYSQDYTFNTMVIEDTIYFLSFEKGEGANKTLFYKGKPIGNYTKK